MRKAIEKLEWMGWAKESVKGIGTSRIEIYPCARRF